MACAFEGANNMHKQSWGAQTEKNPICELNNLFTASITDAS